MNGYVATAQLAKRAEKSGFLVEFICLSAALLDGILRVGLILQHQIKTKSDSIPRDLVDQTNKDRIVSERSIFRRSLKEGVIRNNLFERLESLYQMRNRVIHRYIISDLTTKDVFEIAKKYKEAIPAVSKAIWILEKRQIELGVGMTVRGEGHTGLEKYNEMSAVKHGDPRLARLLQQDHD